MFEEEHSVPASHIRGTKNIFSDHLSRLQIKSSGTWYELSANTIANSLATRELGHKSMLLLGASLNNTSLSSYRKSWQLFRQFCLDKQATHSGPSFPDLDWAFGAFYSIYCGTKVCCLNSFNLHFSASSFPHPLASFPTLHCGVKVKWILLMTLASQSYSSPFCLWPAHAAIGVQ